MPTSSQTSHLLLKMLLSSVCNLPIETTSIASGSQDQRFSFGMKKQNAVPFLVFQDLKEGLFNVWPHKILFWQSPLLAIDALPSSFLFFLSLSFFRSSLPSLFRLRNFSAAKPGNHFIPILVFKQQSGISLITKVPYSPLLGFIQPVSSVFFVLYKIKTHKFCWKTNGLESMPADRLDKYR